MFKDEVTRTDATVIDYINGLAIYASDTIPGLFFDVIPEDQVTKGQQLLDAKFRSVSELPLAMQNEINTRILNRN